MRKFEDETFVEIDKEDDRDERMLETIKHVLHCFGGERFRNTVVVHTRKGSKEEILLERSFRRSGARLDWMANDYNQPASRRLRVTVSRLSRQPQRRFRGQVLLSPGVGGVGRGGKVEVSTTNI